MTGAGAAEVCYSVEDSYATLPGTPTWIQPGVDIEVGSASLDNALTRSRQPDDPRPVESREGNVEGALTVTFTMTDTNFHDLVFADSGTNLASTASLAPTATWYIRADTPGTTVERFCQGAAVESVSWSYTQGEDVTVELTIIYGDESDDLTTPASIQQPAPADCVPFHGTSLTVDSTSKSKLQSATLECSGMARFRRGQQRQPVDAVVGAYEPSMTMEAILSGSENKKATYGSSTATTVQDTIDKLSGSLVLDNASGTVATYNLSNMQPTSYDWSNLVAADADVTDPVDYHVADIAVA